MRKQFLSFLLVLTVSFGPAIQATPESGSPGGSWYESLYSYSLSLAQNVYQSGTATKLRTSRRCRQAVAAFAGVVVMGASSIALYNWPRPDGKWSEDGVPAVTSPFEVVERFTSITFPRERTLWVRDAKNSFGRVFFRGDKIQYFHGNQLVAETCVISPYGRPYDLDHPLVVTVLDSAGKSIGSLIEYSEETEPGKFRVRWGFGDGQGNPTAKSASYVETLTSKRVEGPWNLEFSEVETEATRYGAFARTYVWKEVDHGEALVDPRLKILLSALQSYQQEFRK